MCNKPNLISLLYIYTKDLMLIKLPTKTGSWVISNSNGAWIICLLNKNCRDNVVEESFKICIC